MRGHGNQIANVREKSIGNPPAGHFNFHPKGVAVSPILPVRMEIPLTRPLKKLFFEKNRPKQPLKSSFRHSFSVFRH